MGNTGASFQSLSTVARQDLTEPVITEQRLNREGASLVSLWGVSEVQEQHVCFKEQQGGQCRTE